MESHTKPQSALFQVYLRLRPPPAPNTLYPTLTTPERFLTVEEPAEDAAPTHITLNPPNDNRRRAVEKFAFTEVFEEASTQLDIFHGTGVIPLVEGVLGANGGDGRDGLLATLGVTGSGKSHTILGSRTQRGLTQLSLDLLFRTLTPHLLDPSTTHTLHASLAACDASEAQVLSAQGFLDAIYGEPASRAPSRAATPMRVSSRSLHIPGAFPASPKEMLDKVRGKAPYARPSGPAQSPKSIRLVRSPTPVVMIPPAQVAPPPSYMQTTRTFLTKHLVSQKTTNNFPQGESIPPPSRRLPLPRTSVLPSSPSIADISITCDTAAEYAVVISMYEVYNDRIFDLLTPSTRASNSKEIRRRPLLFKSTEGSAERKVVAGLRKVICGSAKEALLVLEAGLHERRVAGTGSNSVSSRSHGFFCVEVKKRRKGGEWRGSTLTIVDLAGSERARDARTQGATLAEAGKINESLMYLGQCLQLQSDVGNSTKPNLVPYRQCKLTELLFSNSFPTSTSTTPPPRPQRATMIVTADPLGDFAATSQILRYSALAREITVPRIPSISATILASRAPSSASSHHSAGERETMEVAALEIARLSEEVEALRAEVATERKAREEAEARLESAAERELETEQRVREEVWGEMEGRLEEEGRRWKARWEEERERGGEHVDRKLEVLVRLEGEEKENKPPKGREEELLEENRRLRAMVERQGRGRTVLGEARGWEQGQLQKKGEMFEEGMGRERASSGSPVKRVRKLGARRWDVAEEEML